MASYMLENLELQVAYLIYLVFTILNMKLKKKKKNIVFFTIVFFSPS